MKMNRIAVLFILLLIPGSALYAQKNVPKLVVEKYIHNFGNVEAGKGLVHSFKLKNEGTADLQILKVEPT